VNVEVNEPGSDHAIAQVDCSRVAARGWVGSGLVGSGWVGSGLMGSGPRDPLSVERDPARHRVGPAGEGHAAEEQEV
jgi:hypothetical protein